MVPHKGGGDVPARDKWGRRVAFFRPRNIDYEKFAPQDMLKYACSCFKSIAPPSHFWPHNGSVAFPLDCREYTCLPTLISSVHREMLELISPVHPLFFSRIELWLESAPSTFFFCRTSSYVSLYTSFELLPLIVACIFTHFFYKYTSEVFFLKNKINADVCTHVSS